MSDFVNSGWSWFVGGVTVLSLIWCLWLLFVASRRKVMGDDNSTGHVWDDDIIELNNPLPRWWMVLFVVTVFGGAAYLALYPGLGSHGGQLGWTSEREYEEELAKARTDMAAQYAPFAGQPAEVVSKNASAMGIGQRLFLNNCAACHGSDARGSKGFPNLTDTDWLYGGSPEAIEATIRKGRQGVMPAVAAAVGSGTDVSNLANYVLSLSGSPHDWTKAMNGKEKFTVCAACHGVGGKGNPALGAPNLTDKVWLHGWGEQAIVAMINQGKTNVMPAHESRLTDEQIKVLSAYVWGLSNGTAANGK